MSVAMQQRRDTAADWTSVNPVLYAGQLGFETDTGKIKLGDGVTAWTSLPYLSGVTSVNGHTGIVTLTASDVSADAAGSAAAVLAETLPGLTVVAVSSAGALASDTLAEVNATAGTIALTLPAPTAGTQQLIMVEKTDSSANTVTITGTIRGVGAATLTLALQNESVLFYAYGTSWYVLSGHKALVSLDGRYVLLAGATMNGPLSPKVSALTFGASIPVNATLANTFSLTLTASTGTLANPTGGVDGQVIRIRIAQDATGSRTLAYGSAWDFGTTGAPTLSTAASKVDVLAAEYNAALGKWMVLGVSLGY
jgi:major tropism determinant Mtd-like protein